MNSSKKSDGPKYAVAPILKAIKELDSTKNRSNFCLVAYLSTKIPCRERDHGPQCKQHKFSKALLDARDTFELKPFRVDKNAKDS